MEFVVLNDSTTTANGTKDYTSSGFGTPTGAIFILNNAVSGSNPRVDILFSVGFTDGTNQATCGIFADDASANSSTDRESSTGKVLLLANLGAYASFNSWITDGVRLSYTWSFAARHLTVILIKGTTNINVNSFTLTGTSANDITSVGFKPDLVIPITIGSGTASGSAVHAVMSVGAVHNSSTDTVTQASQAFSSPDALATPQCFNTIRNDAGVMQQYNGTVNWKGVFSAFDSSGYSITPDVDPSNDYVFCLNIEDSDPDNFSVDVISSPTSTGTYSVTVPGFQAAFGMIIGGAVQTVNTVESDQDGGVYGIGCFDGTTDSFSGFTEEDNVATSNNQSNYSSTNSVDLYKWGGASFDAFYTGAWDSWNANGYNLNFSTVDATARQWISISYKTAATGLSIPIAAYHYNHNVGSNL